MLQKRALPSPKNGDVQQMPQDAQGTSTGIGRLISCSTCPQFRILSLMGSHLPSRKQSG